MTDSVESAARAVEHTPTTDQVRARFTHRADAPDGYDLEWGAEFDRWLSAERAAWQAAQQSETSVAWDEGFKAAWDYVRALDSWNTAQAIGVRTEIPKPVNPYKS